MHVFACLQKQLIWTDDPEHTGMIFFCVSVDIDVAHVLKKNPKNIYMKYSACFGHIT